MNTFLLSISIGSGGGGGVDLGGGLFYHPEVGVVVHHASI